MMNWKRLTLISLAGIGGLVIALAYSDTILAQAAAFILVGGMVLLAAVVGAGSTAVRPTRGREARRRQKDVATKRANFIAVMENLLRMGKVTFDPRYLQKFVSDAWPLIEEDPDALRWAKFFAASLKMSCEETVAFGGIAL
jgi:hypothetical protein